MGTGDEAAQFRRLDHVVERHGVVVIPCSCDGAGCGACDQVGVAFTAAPGWDRPCGPDCPLNEVAPQ